MFAASSLHVRELSVDLIDSINPFGEAYAVLARTLNADILRQMQEKIAAKRVSIPEEEALALTRRALDWKQERGRAPQITSADAWERTLAEGVAAYQQHVARKKARAAGATRMKKTQELEGVDLLDALGVEVEEPETGGYTPKQERILAGFEDVVRFRESNGRAPQHGPAPRHLRTNLRSAAGPAS